MTLTVRNIAKLVRLEAARRQYIKAKNGLYRGRARAEKARSIDQRRKDLHAWGWDA